MSDKPKTKTEATRYRIAEAKFVAAGSKLDDLPPTEKIEIGFAGRSNVGKSSLLNSLLQRRSLVRTSKTPGATRTINLFEVTVASGPTLVFADLPGYGYAQRSRAERASWGPMLEGYLESRPELVGLVILVDARRGLEEDDVALAQFAAGLNRPLRVVVCVTKLDKLPLSKRKPTLARFGKTLADAGVQADRPVGYSAVTHDGRDELWSRIVALASR